MFLTVYHYKNSSEAIHFCLPTQANCFCCKALTAYWARMLRMDVLNALKTEVDGGLSEKVST